MRRLGLGALLVAVLVLGTACSSGDGGEGKDGAGATTTVVDGGTAPPATDVRSTRDTPVPEARTEVAAAVWDGHIVLAGGFVAGGAPSARLDLLDLSGGRWSRGPDLPAAYDHASLAVLGERLWLVGGTATRDGKGGPTAEVFSLGPGEVAWRQEPSMIEPRAALATAAARGVLVALGGIGSGGGPLRSTEVFDPTEGRWREGPTLAVAREHTAAAAVGGTVFAVAGRQGSLESNLRSVERLTLPGGRWQKGPDLTDGRGGIGATAVGDRPCVAGGEAPGGTIGTVECLVDGRWQVVARLEVPRHGLAVVAVGNQLHVLAGGPTPGLSVSDVHEVFEL